MMRIDNEDEATTERVAGALSLLVEPGDLFILSGGLGAGKTFFTRALLRGMQLDEDEPVTSPTFTLVNEYDVRLPVLHADLYRLSAPEEVDELGLFERRRDGAVLVVEWGRPYVRELGGDALFIDLFTGPRCLVVQGDGQRALVLLEELRAAVFGARSPVRGSGG